mmetsp:Transcript_3142/g.8656  ORF Transcript_3142/g.8656 Transcript_3142/m.8656 type:complete len:294 (-) Transcript_3142:887-1768(-)
MRHLLEGDASWIEEERPEGAVGSFGTPQPVKVGVAGDFSGVLPTSWCCDRGVPRHRVVGNVIRQRTAWRKAGDSHSDAGRDHCHGERFDHSFPRNSKPSPPRLVHHHVQVDKQASRQARDHAHHRKGDHLPPRELVHVRVHGLEVRVESKGPVVLCRVKKRDVAVLQGQVQELVHEDAGASCQEALPEHFRGTQVEATAILKRDEYASYGSRENGGNPSSNANCHETPVSKLGLEIHVALVELELELVRSEGTEAAPNNSAEVDVRPGGPQHHPRWDAATETESFCSKRRQPE